MKKKTQFPSFINCSNINKNTLCVVNSGCEWKKILPGDVEGQSHSVAAAEKTQTSASTATYLHNKSPVTRLFLLVLNPPHPAENQLMTAEDFFFQCV